MKSKTNILSSKTYILCISLWLGGIALYGLGVIFSRHFQVDELFNTYYSRLLIMENCNSFTKGGDVFMIPLGYLISIFHSSEQMVKAARFVFFLFFLGNLILITYGQPYFTSRIGRLLTLIGASLCHILWTYGFEIRHDVLLLTGNLLFFMLTQQSLKNRLHPAGYYFIGGFVFIWTLLSAHKAIIFAIPFSLLLLLSICPDDWWHFPLRKSKKNISYFLLGAGSLFLITMIILQVNGMPLFFETMKSFCSTVGSVHSFSAAKDVLFIAATSPLSLIFSFCFVALSVTNLIKAGSFRLTPSLVTFFYFFWCWIVFLINPQPYPYNLINLMPFIYIAALDVIYRIHFKNQFSRNIFVSLILSTMLILFLIRTSTSKYMNTSNIYQLAYMNAAEQFTDSNQDSILDGIGLVPSRIPPDKDWYLHSNLMNAYKQGKRSSFSEIIEKYYPPVAITNYRWKWLSEKDSQTLKNNYIQLSNDFWVLGDKYLEQNSFFDIHRTGKYIIRSSKNNDDIENITINGCPINEIRVFHFARGRYSLNNVPPEGIVIHWIGPKLNQVLTFPVEPMNNSIVANFWF